MIITMKNTETREISAKIDELHEERGEAALGRVLTLLISTNETSLEHDLAVANNASVGTESHFRVEKGVRLAIIGSGIHPT